MTIANVKITDDADVRRPTPEIVAGFRDILPEYSPSCVIADARQRKGALGGFIPISTRHRVAGPVITVRMVDDEIVDCPTILLRAQPGDIVLIATGGQTHTAMWGGLMSTLARKVGIVGTVIDGAARDIDEIRDLDFPVWHRGVTPRPSPTAEHGRTEPVEVNVPVVVGGQVIEPGDLLVADENGIAVVPSAAAAEVLAETKALIAKEEIIRKKIADGITVTELLAEFGHI